ncbi:MAG TPA: hypothetical protein PK400_02455 [Phycisphaerales bacterium]|nr:hypothetical protein [Phycisphaerales bacterium]HRQ74561.1 hypothetical protein [Phycisphaerales bacterium]
MYESSIAYNPHRIHAAAIYCSDGRVGEHFDDFLQNGLGLPRYDRVALPGGPACLAGHTEAHVHESGVVDELKFLVDVHELERVVLIAHQGCAFYSTRLNLPEPFLEHQQRIDLLKAATFIRRITGIDAVDAFFARRSADQILFEPVALPPRD